MVREDVCYYNIYRIKERRQLSRKAIERGINGLAYVQAQQKEQLDGTKDIYSRSDYRGHSDKKDDAQNAVTSECINLAFEFDDERKNQKQYIGSYIT